jgi:hypothetical protein
MSGREERAKDRAWSQRRRRKKEGRKTRHGEELDACNNEKRGRTAHGAREEPGRQEEDTAADKRIAKNRSARAAQ